MGVVVPDKPQKIKILNHGWYVHVAGRGYVKCVAIVLKLYFSKGIKKYADTLSEKGGYCHFEANATYDCAVCVAGMNTYSLLMLIKHMIVFVSTLL